MSTEEGVWIQFHCCEGYYPINNDQKTVSSQCLNSSWLPDPQTLVCEPIAKGKYGVYIHICAILQMPLIVVLHCSMAML